jgi:hypothetical protein
MSNPKKKPARTIDDYVKDANLCYPKKQPIFHRDAGLTYCYICQIFNFASGLCTFKDFKFHYIFLEEEKARTEYDGLGSENIRKEGLREHMCGKTHLDAFAEKILEPYKKKGPEKVRKSVEELRLEGCACRFRLEYSFAKTHAPFSHILPITRVIISFGGKEGLKEFGHCYNRTSREIIRIIANDLRGWIIFEMNGVKYIGLLYDDGSDCRQVGWFCEWAKFVYPPPSRAPEYDTARNPRKYALVAPPLQGVD